MNIATLDDVQVFLLEGGFCQHDPEAISKVLKKLPKGSDNGKFLAICKLPATFMQKLFGEEFGMLLYVNLERPVGIYALDDKPILGQDKPIQPLQDQIVPQPQQQIIQVSNTKYKVPHYDKFNHSPTAWFRAMRAGFATEQINDGKQQVAKAIEALPVDSHVVAAFHTLKEDDVIRNDLESFEIFFREKTALTEDFESKWLNDRWERLEAQPLIIDTINEIEDIAKNISLLSEEDLMENHGVKLVKKAQKLIKHPVFRNTIGVCEFDSWEAFKKAAMGIAVRQKQDILEKELKEKKKTDEKKEAVHHTRNGRNQGDNKQKAPRNGNAPNRRDNRKCYRCGRAGHLIADCRARKHVDGSPLVDDNNGNVQDQNRNTKRSDHSNRADDRGRRSNDNRDQSKRTDGKWGRQNDNRYPQKIPNQLKRTSSGDSRQRESRENGRNRSQKWTQDRAYHTHSNEVDSDQEDIVNLESEDDRYEQNDHVQRNFAVFADRVNKVAGEGKHRHVPKGAIYVDPCSTLTMANLNWVIANGESNFEFAPKEKPKTFTTMSGEGQCMDKEARFCADILDETNQTVALLMKIDIVSDNEVPTCVLGLKALEKLDASLQIRTGKLCISTNSGQHVVQCERHPVNGLWFVNLQHIRMPSSKFTKVVYNNRSDVRRSPRLAVNAANATNIKNRFDVLSTDDFISENFRAPTRRGHKGAPANVNHRQLPPDVANLKHYPPLASMRNATNENPHNPR
jgi:hypothetical protein